MQSLKQALTDVLPPRVEGYEPPPVSREPTCEVCGGRGWYTREVPRDHSDFGQVVWCQCRADEATPRRLRYSGLAEDQRSMTFEAFGKRDDLTDAQQSDLDNVKRLAGEMGSGLQAFKWLVLLGSKGWGKTHLVTAVVVARLQMAELPAGKFATAPQILRELRAGYDNDNYDSVLSMYQEAPLLVIDDLGTQYQRASNGGGLSWAEEQLFQIIDWRYLRRMETVVTANVGIDSLDERIADRLMDTGTGLAVVANLDLPSYRTGQVVNGR